MIAPKLVRPLAALLPFFVFAAACAGSGDDPERLRTESADLVNVPATGGTGGVSEGSRPPVPYINVVTASGSVTVQWAYMAQPVAQILTYKQSSQGTWYVANTASNVPEHLNQLASWVDVDQSGGAQCYFIEAITTAGQTSSSDQHCTVRPDWNIYPQRSQVPASAVQWNGMSSVSTHFACLDDVQNGTNQYLEYRSRTWETSLGLEDEDHSAILAQRGGPTTNWPFMNGEPLAIHVSGANGGWLYHGRRTLGVDLKLDSVPHYEWYVTGGNHAAGAPIDNPGLYALWNSNAHDYLVAGYQDYGVHLNWYEKTLTTQVQQPPPPGVAQVWEYNCADEYENHPLEFWVRDLTTGTGFGDYGGLDQQWSGGGCPAGGSPWTFVPPVSGHTYELQAIDYGTPGCAPNIGDCIKHELVFVADAHGVVASTVVE